MSDQDDPTIVQSSITPRGSLGSAALSFSSSSISPSTSSSGSHGSAKSAVSECLGAWLNYLQILNNLCASGHRLAQTISTLEQWGSNGGGSSSADPATVISQNIHNNMPPPPVPPQSSQQQQQHQPSLLTPQSQSSPMATQFVTAWDDLARATAVATSTVKSHIVGVLQDFVTQSLLTLEQDTDIQRVREHNQQIIMETAQTMINIQHQFCVASYDSFSPLMCCFVCQAPVGFPHDPECAMVQQQQQQHQHQPAAATPFSRTHPTVSVVGDPRSQTPSPHFAGNFPKNDRDIYRMAATTDSRTILFGSGSTQASSEHSCGGGSAAMTGIVMDGRGPSPHHEIRGPSPIQGFLENIRGPLPNPGHLLGMKTPYYRGSRSPLNFPLFPLSGQRRWSEAAAGEVNRAASGDTIMDAESHMRRWSMPWEASKTVKNTVTWHQTRMMPVSKLAVPISKSNSDRSQSTTPDSIWHSSVTSQDGLAEAIQLLSCRPSRIYQPPPPPPPLGPPFIEEPHSSNIATYEMWSDRTQERLPSIKFPRERDDDNPHHHPT